jgi:hypothetical protein
VRPQISLPLNVSLFLPWRSSSRGTALYPGRKGVEPAPRISRRSVRFRRRTSRRTESERAVRPSPRGPPVAFGRVVEDGPDSGSPGAVSEASGWRLFCGSRASVTANTREHACWRNWAAQKTSTGGLNGQRSAQSMHSAIFHFLFLFSFLYYQILL